MQQKFSTKWSGETKPHLNGFERLVLQLEDSIADAIEHSIEASYDFKKWFAVEMEVAEESCFKSLLSLADPTSCEWQQMQAFWDDVPQEKVAKLQCECCHYQAVAPEYENIPPCPCCGCRVFTIA